MPEITPQDDERIRKLVEDGAGIEDLMQDPLIVSAVEEQDSFPSTSEQAGYGTSKYQDSREFRFGGKKVLGYTAGLERLIDQARKYAGKKVATDRFAVVILGMPAAGKSGIAEDLAKLFRAALPDSDDAKKVLPEYRGGIGANAVHDESSDLFAVMVDVLSFAGENLVIPKVGGDPETIEKLLKLLWARGYEVELAYMKVSPEEAQKRNILRMLSTGGRLVHPRFVADTAGKPEATYDSLVERYGKEVEDHAQIGHARIDNEVPQGTSPRLLDGRGRTADAYRS